MEQALSVTVAVNRPAWETIYWSVQSVDNSYAGSAFAPEQSRAASVVEMTTPVIGGLHDAYPNPFNPSTTISFDLPDDGPVTLQVFDVAGRMIKELLNTRRTPGRYEVVWNGVDDQGKAVASGVYYYRLRAGKLDQTKQMTLVK